MYSVNGCIVARDTYPSSVGYTFKRMWASKKNQGFTIGSLNTGNYYSGLIDDVLIIAR